jgi:D-2-hydroxyacid dehydrogenase (NADP+)
MSVSTGGLLIGSGFARRYEERLREIERQAGARFEHIVVPEDPAARIPPDAVTRIELAYFSGDVFPERSPAFFAAALGAEKLRWLHLFNAGVDHPIFGRFLERGVTVTASPGVNAVPIAQSAMTGLLMLARRFTRFGEAQRRGEWLEHRELVFPPDLATQTLVVLGLGGIGSELARLARAFGLRVVGVRRSRPAEGVVDAWAPPERLDEVLPQADWLAIACPLNAETRGRIDAAALARLPAGAHLVNVARGEIVDEPALVAALESGHVAGAYLDVFAEEPLPKDSPLWRMPNVIVTPHASHVSAGSETRQAERFLANLERFARGEALVDRVTR